MRIAKKAATLAAAAALVLPGSAAAATYNYHPLGMLLANTTDNTHDGHVTTRTKDGIKKDPAGYGQKTRLRFNNTAGGDYSESWYTDPGFTINRPAGWGSIGTIAFCSNLGFSGFSVSCWTIQ